MVAANIRLHIAAPKRDIFYFKQRSTWIYQTVPVHKRAQWEDQFPSNGGVTAVVLYLWNEPRKLFTGKNPNISPVYDSVKGASSISVMVAAPSRRYWVHVCERFQIFIVRKPVHQLRMRYSVWSVFLPLLQQSIRHIIGITHMTKWCFHEGVFSWYKFD